MRCTCDSCPSRSASPAAASRCSSCDGHLAAQGEHVAVVNRVLDVGEVVVDLAVEERPGLVRPAQRRAQGPQVRPQAVHQREARKVVHPFIERRHQIGLTVLFPANGAQLDQMTEAALGHLHVLPQAAGVPGQQVGPGSDRLAAAPSAPRPAPPTSAGPAGPAARPDGGRWPARPRRPACRPGPAGPPAGSRGPAARVRGCPPRARPTAS